MDSSDEKKSAKDVQELRRSPRILAKKNVASIQQIFKKKEKKIVDRFCWICHEESQDEICSKCPRVFHTRCVDPNIPFTENRICPECQMESLDGTELPQLLKLGIFNCLPLFLNIVLLEWEELRHWKDPSEQHCEAFPVRNLEDIKSRISGNYYRMKPTVAFLCDVKTIHHFCHISYDSQDPLTMRAKYLVDYCKKQLIELEACPTCHIVSLYPKYYPFQYYFEDKHPLVWAKRCEEFPFWPAKVLKVTNSVANVRYFGTHDKGLVHISLCYLLSWTSPNDEIIDDSYTTALDEVRSYARLHTRTYGAFVYAELKTEFKPAINYAVKHNAHIELSEDDRNRENKKPAAAMNSVEAAQNKYSDVGESSGSKM